MNIYQEVLTAAGEGRKAKQKTYQKPAHAPVRYLRPIRSERYDLTKGQISMHQEWDKLMGAASK